MKAKNSRLCAEAPCKRLSMVDNLMKDGKARSGYRRRDAAGSRRPGIRGRYKRPILGSVQSAGYLLPPIGRMD
jgi:hypothetical protein